MIAFLSKGGVLVIPILLCSVLALAIFAERLIQFTRLRSRGAGLTEKVVALINKGNAQEAYEKAVKSRSPMGQVLAQAMGPGIRTGRFSSPSYRRQRTRKSANSLRIPRPWPLSAILPRCWVSSEPLSA